MTLFSVLPLLFALAPTTPAVAPTAAPLVDPGTQQQQVRNAVRKGQLVPLEGVVADALRRYPGKLVEVELEDGEYEIEILGADGVVMELEYDASTGRFLSMEVDD